MSDEQYFDRCIELAKIAFNNGDIPVGALIVKDDTIIAEAYNCKFAKNVSIYHAELLCIEEACKKLGDWRLNGCTMYVTLEPCSMCYGALVESRIDKVVYLLDSTYKETFNNNYDKLTVFKYKSVKNYDILLKSFFEIRRKKNISSEK